MLELPAIAKTYELHYNFGLSRLFRAAGVGVEVQGRGARVSDHLGHEYLDFCTSFGVFNLGYANPRVAQALLDQLETMPIIPPQAQCPAQTALEARLGKLLPPELAVHYYSGSGSEGVEMALRLAHDFWRGRRRRLVTADRGYHGKTLGALGVIGQKHLRKPFEPLFDDVVHVRSADPEQIVSAIDENCAAVIVEPVVAGNFLHVPAQGYLAAVRQRCDQTGTILIVDEVQTAFGRTGHLMGIDRDGIVPDILVASKSLTGGHLPFAVTSVHRRLTDELATSGTAPIPLRSHMSGGPLACAVASAALDEIVARNLPGNAAAMGERLLAGLKRLAAKFPRLIKRADGLGLMTGIEVSGRAVEFAIYLKMLRRSILIGLSLNPGSRTPIIRLYPPLDVSAADIDHVLNALEEALMEIDRLPQAFLGAVHYATRYAPYFPAPLARIARKMLS
ncbi:MAG: aspartate aminotransferase family protein [Novosphingobium sp.]